MQAINPTFQDFLCIKYDVSLLCALQKDQNLIVFSVISSSFNFRLSLKAIYNFCILKKILPAFKAIQLKGCQ